MQVDFAATGNHEYDQGVAELLRMQNGGCEKFTNKQPCQISQPFKGRSSRFWRPIRCVKTAGRCFRRPGEVLRAGRSAHRRGLYRHDAQEHAAYGAPQRGQGLTFADEAQTANALIPQLRAQGAM
jgi:5'-nucleotidase